MASARCQRSWPIPTESLAVDRSSIELLGPGYQADDRQLAVGLLSVFGVAGCCGGDLSPRLVVLGSVELLGDHFDVLAGGIDLHLRRW
jgi:hypothetical protein